MYKIYNDTEIKKIISKALIFSNIYKYAAISLFIYAGYLIFNDSILLGYISLFCGIFLLIVFSIYQDIFNKYTNQSSSQRIKTIIKEIEPYADLRDIFKKMYARGYLLNYEENLLSEEVNLKNAEEYTIRLNQDIQSTLNHWENV